VNGVGQALGIDGNMTFNTRHLLASIIAFVLGCIGILYALSINNQESGVLGATMGGADLAN
jgi:hypothetical protein